MQNNAVHAKQQHPIPPAVAFIARSGTGKTTLIEAVIGELAARGRRIGALKHDAHRFEIDQPGKDSRRFTEAGAEVMVLASDETVAMVRKPREPEKLDTILRECFTGMDLVLVEGYKTSRLPKIEVQRIALNQPLLCRGVTHDPWLVAVVSDGRPTLDVPVLPLAQPGLVADWLEQRFLRPARLAGA